MTSAFPWCEPEWSVGCPGLLTPVLMYKVGMGLAGVWTAMAIDLILRGILCVLRWRGGRWQKRCDMV